MFVFSWVSLAGMSIPPFASSAEECDSVAFRKICSLMREKVGDEVASCLLEADSMVAGVVRYGTDNLQEKSVGEWMVQLVKYTLCQPAMYKSDKRVYASFSANAWLEIVGKNPLIIELDYNIYKWRLSDKDGNVLCRYDLHDSELLSMFRMLFPESEIIHIKYNRFVQDDEK